MLIVPLTAYDYERRLPLFGYDSSKLSCAGRAATSPEPLQGVAGSPQVLGPG